MESSQPSSVIKEISNDMKSFCVSNESKLNESLEPETPIQPSGSFKPLKDSFVDSCLRFVNSASKEELKKIKGIGETRATSILEKREKSKFEELDDLKEIGFTEKQIKGMLKNVGKSLFN